MGCKAKSAFLVEQKTVGTTGLRMNGLKKLLGAGGKGETRIKRRRRKDR